MSKTQPATTDGSACKRGHTDADGLTERRIMRNGKPGDCVVCARERSLAHSRAARVGLKGGKVGPVADADMEVLMWVATDRGAHEWEYACGRATAGHVYCSEGAGQYSGLARLVGCGAMRVTAPCFGVSLYEITPAGFRALGVLPPHSGAN